MAGTSDYVNKGNGDTVADDILKAVNGLWPTDADLTQGDKNVYQLSDGLVGGRTAA